MLGVEEVAIFVHVERGAGSYFCPCWEEGKELFLSMLGGEQVAISVHVGRRAGSKSANGTFAEDHKSNHFYKSTTLWICGFATCGTYLRTAHL